MHVFWRILQHAITSAIVQRINRHALEPAPAKTEDEWVVCLQNTFVPAMLLYAYLQKGKGCLIC